MDLACRLSCIRKGLHLQRLQQAYFLTSFFYCTSKVRTQKIIKRYPKVIVICQSFSILQIFKIGCFSGPGWRGKIEGGADRLLDIRKMPWRCQEDVRKMSGRCQKDVNKMSKICHKSIRNVKLGRQEGIRKRAGRGWMTATSRGRRLQWRLKMISICSRFC